MTDRMIKIRRGRELAQFLACSLIPFLVVAGDGVLGRVFGLVAGVSLIISVFGTEPRADLWLVAAVSGTVGSVVGPVWFRGTAYHAGLIGLAAIGLTLVLLVQRNRLSGPRALVIAGASSLLVLVWSLSHDPGGLLDVTVMHQAAADALRAGASPWADLAVPAGAPGEAGTVYTGDPYPPVTLALYSVSDWVTDDPRMAGVLGWVVLVVSTLTLAAKNHLPAIVLLTSGSLPLMLWTGWTDLLTISLVVAAVALWRSPLASSVILGVALASRQPMVVALPVILAMRSRPQLLRKLVTISVAAIGALAGFAMGAGYLDATIFNFAEYPPRDDSASLYGFVTVFVPAFKFPFWIGPIAAFATAVWLAARNAIDGPARLLEMAAVSLAVLFLLGTQAFSNYWFLVWALVLVARSIRRENSETAASQGALLNDGIPE